MPDILPIFADTRFHSTNRTGLHNETILRVTAFPHNDRMTTALLTEAHHSEKTTMKTTPIFVYGDKEIDYLKGKDRRLAEVIDRVGKIERAVIPDLFAALVHSIVGQQISTKAHRTVWERMKNRLGHITPERIDRLEVNELQQCGISHRKANYIKKAARKVMEGEIDIEALKTMSDEEVCRRLMTLDGVGLWTAEMLLIFSLQRPDVLSYGDLGLIKGMKMVYRHRQITKSMFDRHKRRLSPYASVAAFYFWEVAAGALDRMEEDTPHNEKEPG